jgi:hypothetical protein
LPAEFKAQIGGGLSRPIVKIHDTQSSLQRRTIDAAFDGEAHAISGLSAIIEFEWWREEDEDFDILLRRVKQISFTGQSA